MGYRKIVVGTDGSPTANVARDAAIGLARRFRAQLVLVCAYDEPGAGRDMAEAVLRTALDEAGRAKVEAVGALLQADPAELILSVAEEQGANLVVVGNKGMGHPSRFRLGSVPDRVAHFAPCDLLIVETSRADPSSRTRGPRYRHVLAGTDGSPTAGEAARKAFELALLMRAKAMLVFVGDPLVGAIRLEETARSAPEGVEVETTAAEGDPAEEICAIAEREGADLIVVGNKGMSGARRFLLGSVPNKVAHYAPTDVLIAKTVERTAEEIEPGHGAVIEYGGRTTAVYRDEQGAIHALSPRCTHMGCTVDWNDAEKTWDCPCHGSRFSADGKVIQGPATRGLDGSEKAPAPAPRAPAVPAPTARSRRAEQFVIVGASLAGGTAAATLREEGFDGKLVLIGAEAHYPYERPPLSKAFLRGEVAFEEALVRPVAFFRDNDVDVRFATLARSVDPSERTVELSSGDRVRYDRLLIATGARNRRFPIAGIDLPGVYDLRTVGDAEGIRSKMVPGRKVVVCGLGFIGSEVAASLRQSGLDVTAVEGLRTPLEHVLGEDVGRVLEGVHRDHGVRVILEDAVAAFEGIGRVGRVVTKSGLRLECDFVVVGFGVEPVVDVVAGTGVEVDNGILVDEYCRSSVEGIYAAGDVANHLHPLFGRRMRIEHWQNAIRQGRGAALNLLDRKAPYEEIHWFWSDQYEHNIQYTGFHTDWDEIVVRGSLEDRNFVAFYVRNGRVQAAVAMDRGQDIRAAAGLIRTGATVDPAKLRDGDVELVAEDRRGG